MHATTTTLLVILLGLASCLAQQAPTLTLGGDVVDGAIPAWKFYSAAGAEIHFVFCNARMTNPDPAEEEDFCEQFHADSGNTGWSGTTSGAGSATQELFTPQDGVSCGGGFSLDVDSGISTDLTTVDITYGLSSEDYWLTADQTFTFTLQDNSLFDPLWGGQDDSTAWVENAQGTVVVLAEDNASRACAVSFSDTDAAWMMIHGGTWEITIESHSLGAFTASTRQSIAGAIISTGDSFAPVYVASDVELVGYSLNFDAGAISITLAGTEDDDEGMARLGAALLNTDWGLTDPESLMTLTMNGGVPTVNLHSTLTVSQDGISTSLANGDDTVDGATDTWFLIPSSEEEDVGLDGIITPAFDDYPVAVVFGTDGDSVDCNGKQGILRVDATRDNKLTIPAATDCTLADVYGIAGTEVEIDGASLSNDMATLTFTSTAEAWSKGDWVQMYGEIDGNDEATCNYFGQIAEHVADTDTSASLMNVALTAIGAHGDCDTPTASTVTFSTFIRIDEASIRSMKAVVTVPADTSFSINADETISASVVNDASYVTNPTTGASTACEGSFNLAAPTCTLSFNDGNPLDYIRGGGDTRIKMDVTLENTVYVWADYNSRLTTLTVTDANGALPEAADWESQISMSTGLTATTGTSDMTGAMVSVGSVILCTSCGTTTVGVVSDFEEGTTLQVNGVNLNGATYLVLETSGNTAELDPGFADGTGWALSSADLLFSTNNGLAVDDIIVPYNFLDSDWNCETTWGQPAARIKTVTDVDGATEGSFTVSVAYDDADCLADGSTTVPSYVGIKAGAPIDYAGYADSVATIGSNEDVVAGDWVYVECDGAEGEIVQVLSVDGTSLTFATALSDCTDSGQMLVLHVSQGAVELSVEFDAEADYWTDSNPALELTIAAANLAATSQAITCTHGDAGFPIAAAIFEFEAEDIERVEWFWTDYYMNTITETTLRGEISVQINGGEGSYNLAADLAAGVDAFTEAFAPTETSSLWNDLRDSGSTGCEQDPNDENTNIIICTFADLADQAVDDFDIADPMTVTVAVTLTADTMDTTAPTDITDSIIHVDGDLIIYPDGLLDHVAEYKFDTVNPLITWINGPHHNDIAWAQLHSVHGGVDVWIPAVPSNAPVIGLQDTESLFQADALFEAADMARLIVGDVMGNVISSRVVAGDAEQLQMVWGAGVHRESEDGWWADVCTGAYADTSVFTCGGAVTVAAGEFVKIESTDLHDAIYGFVTVEADGETTFTVDSEGATATDATATVWRGAPSDVRVVFPFTYHESHSYGSTVYYDLFDVNVPGEGLSADSGQGGSYSSTLSGVHQIRGLEYGHTYHYSAMVAEDTAWDLEWDNSNLKFSVVVSPPMPAGIPYTISAGADSLTIAWRPPPANGGFPITKYTLQCTTSEPRSVTWDDFTTPTVSEEVVETDASGMVLPMATITTLTANTKYTCRVISSNHAGDSTGLVNGLDPGVPMHCDGAVATVSNDLSACGWEVDRGAIPAIVDGSYRYLDNAGAWEVAFTEEEVESMSSPTVYYTDHILTAFDTTSTVSSPHPIIDLTGVQEHDGDDYKITFSWSANSEGTGNEAITHYQVVVYDQTDTVVTYGRDELGCVSTTEFVLCGPSWPDSTECDYVTEDAWDHHVYAGIGVTPLNAANNVPTPLTNRFVYTHGAGGATQTVGVSLCDQPAVPSNYDWSALTKQFVGQTYFSQQVESAAKGEAAVDFADSSFDVDDFTWSVHDVNRDAAYITFDLPCIYKSDGSTGSWTTATLVFDDADTFHSDFNSYELDITDVLDVSFTPTGLEGDQTYSLPAITFVSEDVDEAAAGWAGGADDVPVETLTWLEMWPLMLHPPTVTESAESPTSLGISWSPPASDGGSPVRYYEISHRSEGSNWEEITFSDGTTEFSVSKDTVEADLSYDLTGLLGGHTYHFRVRACNRQVYAVEEADVVYPRCSRWSTSSVGRTGIPTSIDARTITAEVLSPTSQNAAQITISVTDVAGAEIVEGTVYCMNAAKWLADFGSTFDVQIQEDIMSVHLGNAMPSDDAAENDRYYYDASDLVYNVQFLDLATETDYRCYVHVVDSFGQERSYAAFDFTTAADDSAEILQPLGVEVASDTVYYVVPGGHGADIDSCDVIVRTASADGSCGSAPTTFDSIADTQKVVDGSTGDSGTIQSVGLSETDYDDATSSESGLNEYFCAYVYCEDNGNGGLSDGYWFQAPAGYPSDDATLTVLDSNDKAALFLITPPTSDGGSDIVTYYIECGEVTASFTAPGDFNTDSSGELVLEAHVTGYTAGTTYECYVTSENAIGLADNIANEADSIAATISLTTSAATGDVGGVRQMPLQARRPFLHTTGVTAEYAVGNTITREVVTHQSIRVKWELLCTVAVTDSQCYGSADSTFTDADTVGTDATKYERTAGIGVPDPGTDDVSIIANILKVVEDGGDPVYHWYADSVVETGQDEFIDLKGSTTYTFAVGHVSNYLPFLRSNTLDDVKWSTELSVTTDAPSAPDTPYNVVVDDADAGWHTRSALFVNVEEYGDGYNLLSPNGAIVTKFNFECRPTSETTSWSDSNVKKGSLTSSSATVPAPTSGAVTGISTVEEFACRAQAVSPSGTSGWSPTYDTDTRDTNAEDATAPLRMHSPRVTASTSSSVSLTWSQPGDDDGKAVVGYVIGGDVSHDTEDGSVTSYTFTGLTPYTEYEFTLQAYNKLDFVCDEDMKSVASEPTVAWTGLRDNTLGQESTMSLPSIASTTAGSTVVLIEFGSELDIASGHATAYVDIEKADVQADTEALTWAEIDDTDNMWDGTDLQPGWAIHPFRYLTGLTASTDYQLRFIGQVQPAHPLGADAPTMTTFGTVSSVQTAAEPVPMPPLPVSQDGTAVVQADTEPTVNNSPGEAKYITFDIAEGVESPEKGVEGGSEVEFGYLVTTSAGTSTPKTITTVDTKSSSGHFSIEDPDNPDQTISSLTTLKANTEYSFSVRWSDSEGTQGVAFDDFVTQTTTCGNTDQVTGVSLVTSTAITSTAALFKWSAPTTRGSNIESYSIECFTLSDLSDTPRTVANIPADWTTWYINGLTEGTDYYCRVSAGTTEVACSSVDAEQGVQITTLSSNPLAPLKSLPPYLPTCEATTSVGLRSSTTIPTTTSLEIAWPYFSTVGALQGAVPSGSLDFAHDFQWKTTTMSSYQTLNHDEVNLAELTGIDASATYHFRVRAVNAAAVGEWSEVLQYPDTGDVAIDATAPDTPSSIIVLDQKRASVLLTWGIADNGGAVVDSVEIECKRGPAVGDDTDIWLYSTEVTGTDGAVSLVDGNVRAPSQVDAEAFGLSSSDDFEYYCRLRASNSHGTSQWSAPVTSGQAAPVSQGQPLAPFRPELVETPKVDTVRIRFFPTFDDDGSPVREYQFYANDLEMHTATPTDFDVNGGFVEKEFTGLLAGTFYEFKATCFNRHVFTNSDTYEGTSTDSPVLAVATANADRPAEPSAPIFQDTLLTQTGFSWVLPNDNGSPISGIALHCNEALTEDVETVEDGVTVTTQEELPAAQQTPYESSIDTEICDSEASCAETWRLVYAISGFTASKVYFCVLSATNAVGTTFASSTGYARLVMKAEGDEDVDQLPIFEQPSLSAITSESLTVNWVHPFSATGLTYTVAGDNGAGTFSDLTTSSQGFTGLLPNQVYTFTVTTTSGTSSGLTGGYVKTVSGTTSAGVPGDISGLTVVDTTQTGALLSWSRPDSVGSEIVSYSIGCDAEAGETLDILNTEFVARVDLDGLLYGYINGLTADTTYKCKIRAHNGIGDGDWSGATATAKTKDEIFTQPITSLPPFQINDSSGSGEPHEFEDGHLTSPTEIKIGFGTEVTDADQDFTDGLGNNAGATTLVAGYIVRWGIEGGEMHELFLHGGDILDEDDQFYIFTGLAGGTDYAFSVKSFTEEDDNTRHLPDSFSSSIIVTTADYARQDVPDLPVLKDVSEEVLLVYIPNHDNGSPSDSENQFEVECREKGDDEYLYSSSSLSPYVYVRIPGSVLARTWICRAEVANLAGESVTLSGWSYDSWPMTLDGIGAGPEPLMAVPPVQTNGTAESVSVTFYPPPVAGGVTSPSVHIISLYWMTLDAWEGLTSANQELSSSFTSSVSHTLSEWCDMAPNCDEAVLTEDYEDLQFKYTIDGLAGLTEYAIVVESIAGTTEATEKMSPLSDIGCARTTESDRPADVTSFTLVDVTDSAFLLQWDSPRSNGSPITKFTIECADPDFEDEEKTIYTSEYVLSDIPTNGDNDGDEVDNAGDENWQYYIDLQEADAGTSFTCRIKSSNDIGTSNGAALDSTVNVDGTPADLQLLSSARDTPLQMLVPYQGDVDPTFTSVTLIVDQGPDSAIHTKYRVGARIASSKDVSHNIVAPGSTITVTTLQAYRPYRFTVQATASSAADEELTDSDFSPISVESLKIRTAAGPPRKTRQIITNFDVSGDDVEGFDNDAAQEALCDPEGDLFSGTDFDSDNCHIEVFAGSVKVTLSVFTLEDTDAAEAELTASITSAAVSSVLGTEVTGLSVSTGAVSVAARTNDAFYLTWPPFDSAGSELTAYTIKCSTADPVTGEYTFADELSQSASVAAVNGYLEPGGAIAGLEHTTDYKCRISATNGQGTYEATDVDETEVITTLGIDTIVKPLRTARPWVEAVTETSLTLSWTTPASLGGTQTDGNAFSDLTGYTIQYEIASQTDVVQSTVSTGDSTSTEITGLKRGQEYRLTVAGDNSVQTGDLSYSEWVTGKLLDATPAAPARPVGSPDGSDSVTITLRGVDNDGIRIDGGLPLVRYLVQFHPAPPDNGDQAAFDAAIDNIDWDADPSSFSTPVEGVEVYPVRVEVGGLFVNTQRSVQLTGLDENNADGYAVRYAAVNELGTGEWSEPSVIRTSPQPPTQIQEVSLVAATSEGLDVTFSAPSSNGGSEVTRYSITFTEGAGGPNNGATLPAKNFAIGDLTANIDGTYTASLTTTGPGNTVYRGASYSATVIATNAIGSSDPSVASDSVAIPAGVPYAPVATLTPSEEAGSGSNSTSWKVDVTMELGWNGGSAYTAVVMDLTNTDGVSKSVTADSSTITDANPTASASFGGLVAGGDYSFRATVTNGEGTIEYLDSVTTSVSTPGGNTGPTSSGSTTTGAGSSAQSDSIVTPASTTAPGLYCGLVVAALLAIFF